MKTTQDLIIEKGMQPRRIIFETLEAITCDYSRSQSEKNTSSKIVSWHIGLEGITDQQINHGLKTLLKSPSDFPPTCGKFRKLCLSRQEWKPEAPAVERKPDLEARKRFFEKIKAITRRKR